MSITKLKKALKEENVIFGTKRTLKNLKLGRTKAVFISSNCPREVKKQIKLYKNIDIIELKIPNDELAMICKRAHPISVLSY